jgi:hypothetical protein
MFSFYEHYEHLCCAIQLDFVVLDPRDEEEEEEEKEQVVVGIIFLSSVLI